jgi:hypothetical protein
VQVLLGNVEDADLEHLVGFGVVDHEMQTAPGTFEFLEILVVQDQVDLLGQLSIDLGDDRLDRMHGVRRNQARVGEDVFRQGLHGGLDRLLGAVRLGPEFLGQQSAEFVGLDRLGFGLRLLFGVDVSHRNPPLSRPLRPASAPKPGIAARPDPA